MFRTTTRILKDKAPVQKRPNPRAESAPTVIAGSTVAESAARPDRWPMARPLSPSSGFRPAEQIPALQRDALEKVG